MDIRIDFDTSGPLFDGSAVGVIHRYGEHVAEVLGDEGVTRIRAYLPTQYMYLGHNGGDPQHNPVPPDAGALAASVQAERQAPERMVIYGDRVTYGAWIEGTSDLNSVVWPGRIRRGLGGRFPGYHTFRKISQEIDVDATDIATRELPPYIGELNA